MCLCCFSFSSGDHKGCLLSPGFNKGLLTEFIGILSTSNHGNKKTLFFLLSDLIFHGGGHTANWALLASLCKILVMHFFYQLSGSRV
ncbi:hypothetical protein E1A91_A01G113300v1 [Gossypium mustelinum]|uniref:Uncharacterized protein n=1 Tax=Gossypium mustelinum TaxID=34275 RepID=A0A5D3AH00_GOSMU|nr:hypothetical protein E1A91_A01G113300v1 [Gossypium mustelinum]